MSILNKKGRPFANERVNLVKLYQWFLVPMTEKAEPGVDPFRYLEALWGVKERSYSRYKAKQGFKLPGLYLETPANKRPYDGVRAVSAGQHLFVRREPVLQRHHVTPVDVPDNDEQVFELTQMEWDSIERFLEEVPDPCNHLPYRLT